MSNYKKGSTLKDQVYKEGESTWGCKSGVLDVDDVKRFIEDIKDLLCESPYLESQGVNDLFEDINLLSGFALNTIEETNV